MGSLLSVSINVNCVDLSPIAIGSISACTPALIDTRYSFSAASISGSFSRVSVKLQTSTFITGQSAGAVSAATEASSRADTVPPSTAAASDPLSAEPHAARDSPITSARIQAITFLFICTLLENKYFMLQANHQTYQPFTPPITIPLTKDFWKKG